MLSKNHDVPIFIDKAVFYSHSFVRCGLCGVLGFAVRGWPSAREWDTGAITVTSYEDTMASQITDNSADCSIACLANNKDIRSPYYWPFVKGIHRWPMDSPHKGPVIQKTFPCHGGFMTKQADRPYKPPLRTLNDVLYGWRWKCPRLVTSPWMATQCAVKKHIKPSHYTFRWLSSTTWHLFSTLTHFKFWKHSRVLYSTRE